MPDGHTILETTRSSPLTLTWETRLTLPDPGGCMWVRAVFALRPYLRHPRWSNTWLIKNCCWFHSWLKMSLLLSLSALGKSGKKIREAQRQSSKLSIRGRRGRVPNYLSGGRRGRVPNYLFGGTEAEFQTIYPGGAKAEFQTIYPGVQRQSSKLSIRGHRGRVPNYLSGGHRGKVPNYLWATGCSKSSAFFTTVSSQWAAFNSPVHTQPFWCVM